jgi:hypothetical protein
MVTAFAPVPTTTFSPTIRENTSGTSLIAVHGRITLAATLFAARIPATKPRV